MPIARQRAEYEVELRTCHLDLCFEGGEQTAASALHLTDNSAVIAWSTYLANFFVVGGAPRRRMYRSPCDRWP